MSQTSPDGTIPLPEGVSKYSPFATNQPHPLNSDAVYMLEHPCFAMRGLEQVAISAFKQHTNALKQRFGLTEINHTIKGNNSDFKLFDAFVGTYWGLTSLIMGTSMASNYRLIRPTQDDYPIGYTRLPTPAAIFRQHVPVLTSTNSYWELTHCLHYTIGQEISKRFVYALYPFVDQSAVAVPHLNLIDGKLGNRLMEVINHYKLSEVNLSWSDLVNRFGNTLTASQNNDLSFFQESPEPLKRLFENMQTAPDSFSLGQAIALSAQNAYKPVMLTIVPENKIQLFPMPQVPTAERKAEQLRLENENRLRGQEQSDRQTLISLEQEAWRS